MGLAAILGTCVSGFYFFHVWKDAFVDALVRVHAVAPIVQVHELSTGTQTSIKPRWRRVALVGAPVAQLPLLTFAFDISGGFYFLAMLAWLALGPLTLWWGWCYGLRSRIHIDPTGVRVVNPARTTKISWADLARVRLTEVTRGKHTSGPYTAYCLTFRRRHGPAVTAVYPCFSSPGGGDLASVYRAIMSAIYIQMPAARRGRGPLSQ